jgi:2-keto-4-pentenoate hydratase/2-oxohepta-3-ene-1,7-dioic acid hydratase in catechol pathway
MTWSIEELLAWASAGEHVSTGALIGSGTVGSGCGLEVGRGLEPGDVVELEIEGIGTLRNRIGRATSHGYMPRPRAPVARGG